MTNKVIEKIAGVIKQAIQQYVETGEPMSPLDIAQAILDLRYDCGECKGSGEYSETKRGSDGFDKCPTCKGTGKGKPILAILDEDQKLPDLQPYVIVSDGMQTRGWIDKPDSEGWWWLKWDELNGYTEPRWVFETSNGFLVESYEETEDRDYYKCQMQPVTSYKGKWWKAIVPGCKEE